MTLSELAFAPNPARSSSVIAQYPVAIKATLTIRDVLGATVNSSPLVPSGRTRLDLRSLAPGVYMATLDAETQSLTRKLVITVR